MDHGSVLVNHVPPKKEPVFAAADASGGDGRGAGDDYACNIGVDADSYDYGSPQEDPESKVIDVYYHPLKEEPNPELGDGDGDAVDVKAEPEPEFAVTVGGEDGGSDDHAPDISVNTDDCYYDPPKKEPRAVFPAKGDDTDADSCRDVGYDCSHCGAGLSTREFKVEHELRCKVRMKRMELESQVTKLYHCCYCRCPFIDKELKEQHQRRWCRKKPVAKRRNSNGPHFECDKCQFVTKYKMCLARHLLTHNKNKREWFTCTQCSYKTVHQCYIATHMKIHSNTFSYCCPICGKSFRRKTCLDDHLLRRHSDESDEVSKLITSKVYTCNICSRFRTLWKADFNRHVRKHVTGVGGQKYECSRCPYSTFRKGDLTKHSKTHAEQKNYRCSVCKKQFARKAHLDSHILSNHADNVDLVKTITSKVHRCESCSYKTVRKSNLKKHVRSKHT